MCFPTQSCLSFYSRHRPKIIRPLTYISRFGISYCNLACMGHGSVPYFGGRIKPDWLQSFGLGVLVFHHYHTWRQPIPVRALYKVQEKIDPSALRVTSGKKPIGQHQQMAALPDRQNLAQSAGEPLPRPGRTAVRSVPFCHEDSCLHAVGVDVGPQSINW